MSRIYPTSLQVLHNVPLAHHNDHLFPLGECAVGAPRLWQQNYTGKGIIVAVLDQGIAAHPDLAGRILQTETFVRDWQTPGNHGTAMAGTIAGHGWLRGIAYNAKLLDYRVMNDAGGTVPDAVRGIQAALQAGAHIINCSFGTNKLTSYERLALNNAITDAYNRGALVIAASGNSGVGLCTVDELVYPAALDLSVSVGSCSLNEKLNPNGLSSYSNENEKVNLIAPGNEIYTTGLDGKYASVSGTSIATAMVSGVAACLAEKLQRETSLLGGSFSQELLVRLYRNCLTLNDICKISQGAGMVRYEPLRGPSIPALSEPWYITGKLAGYVGYDGVGNVNTQGTIRRLITYQES